MHVCSNGGFLTYFAGAGVELEEYGTTSLSCPLGSLVIGFETVAYAYGFQSVTVRRKTMRNTHARVRAYVYA